MTNEPRPWQQPTAPIPQQPAKKGNTVAVIALGAIALSVLVCGGVFVNQAVTSSPDPKVTTTAPRNLAALPTTEAVQAPVETVPTVAAPTTETVVTPTVTATPTRRASPAPTRTTTKPTVRPTTRKPKPRPTTTKPKPRPTTKAPTGQKGVHPGSFCSPEGATGFTNKGTRMRCTLKSGEDRARWRKA